MTSGTAILADWGTTRLRLFRMEDGRLVDRVEGPGIGRLAGSPAEALIATLGDWSQLASACGVTLCGMAGSRNGLVEVAYARCPADRAAWSAAAGALDVAGIRVAVAAGLAGTSFIGASDVMRGEETQVFGALAEDPALASGRTLVVLPGTHSKWVDVVDGRIMRFQTFLTGETFALLRDHSTLTRAGTDAEGREAGFVAGLDRARSSGALLGALFEARAGQLVDGRPHGWALGFLSGLLIGREVAEGGRLASDGGGFGRIVLVGDPDLSALYARALAGCDIEARQLDGDRCVLNGLMALAARAGEAA